MVVTIPFIVICLSFNNRAFVYDRHGLAPYLEKLYDAVSHDFDIDEIINSADRKLFSQITQPRHCLHHLLPPMTSTHCPYSLRKRQISYLMLNIHSIKSVSSLVVYLTFDDYDMTVMVMCSSDNEFG